MGGIAFSQTVEADAMGLAPVEEFIVDRSLVVDGPAVNWSSIQGY